ncbi:MAG TPA: hypothetical protein VEI25_14685 [Paraburkholderia sp.]|nr:hypothetical protein [Paraburkholderia sp.]
MVERNAEAGHIVILRLSGEPVVVDSLAVAGCDTNLPVRAAQPMHDRQLASPEDHITGMHLVLGIDFLPAREGRIDSRHRSDPADRMSGSLKNRADSVSA